MPAQHGMENALRVRAPWHSDSTGTRLEEWFSLQASTLLLKILIED